MIMLHLKILQLLPRLHMIYLPKICKSKIEKEKVVLQNQMPPFAFILMPLCSNTLVGFL